MDDIWTPPSHPLWPRFAYSVDFLLLEWDVLNAIVDGGYGWGNPRENKDKLIDDLLANFAEKWKAQQDVEPQEVNNFFIGTLDDLFNADVDAGTVSVVSNLLVKLYRECRQGIETGILAVEARNKPKIENVDSAVKAFENAQLGTQSTSANQSAALQGASTAIQSENSTQVEMGSAQVNSEQQSKAEEQAADDGWEVVTKKKGRRRQG